MIKNITHIFTVLVVFSQLLLGQSKLEYKIKLDNHKYFEERIMEISINKNDSEFYKIKKLLPPHFSIPEVVVFENGNSALIHSLEGIIEFYSNGALQKQIKLLDDNFYNESSVLFSINKNKIALLITDEQKNKIILLDDFGNEIFTKHSQDGLGSGIAYSAKNDILVVSINNWEGNKLISKSIFTNNKTNSEFTVPHKFEKGLFENNSSTFLGHSNNELFLVNLNSNKVLWNKKAEPNSLFIQSRIKDNDVLVVKATSPKLTNGSWKYKNAEIVSFDLNGTEKSLQMINKQFESLDIIEDGEKLYLDVDSSRIKIY